MIDVSFFLLLAAATLLTGCGEPNPSSSRQSDMRFKISHYKVPCTGADVQLCLLVSKDGGETEYFYDAIEGFEYEWGYEYEISVEQSPVKQPMADASSVSYKLKAIVQKARVAPETEFELPLNMEGLALVESGDTGCSYFGDVAIDPGERTCEALTAAQSAVFRHSARGLVVVDIK